MSTNYQEHTPPPLGSFPIARPLCGAGNQSRKCGELLSQVGTDQEGAEKCQTYPVTI